MNQKTVDNLTLNATRFFVVGSGRRFWMWMFQCDGINRVGTNWVQAYANALNGAGKE